jgi:hypothetical protein
MVVVWEIGIFLGKRTVGWGDEVYGFGYCSAWKARTLGTLGGRSLKKVKAARRAG